MVKRTITKRYTGGLQNKRLISTTTSKNGKVVSKTKNAPRPKRYTGPLSWKKSKMVKRTPPGKNYVYGKVVSKTKNAPRPKTGRLAPVKRPLSDWETEKRRKRALNEARKKWYDGVMKRNPKWQKE